MAFPGEPPRDTPAPWSGVALNVFCSPPSIGRPTSKKSPRPDSQLAQSPLLGPRCTDAAWNQGPIMPWVSLGPTP